MTIDEELTHLDELLRRLKIEYDIFFGGGSKRPPADSEWRVQAILKKYSDSHKMSFAQRFRFNTIQQKYAIFSDLWRQKVKIKEEGFRRPQDAVLGIQGMRVEEEAKAREEMRAAEPFRVACSDVDSDHEKVQALFNAMVEARKQAGDAGAGAANFESFKSFVKKKTDQLRKDYGCHAVEYAVEVENGQVRLKAKAKV
ncbi:MAG TPA: MXAN_5187 C-terminal domain-containing protein [Terriglobales bacterium]|jgi:hypothetical protein|nr:MXAN_5187 C-terminal domain-containing protein [Terriglobales bacterium]